MSDQENDSTDGAPDAEPKLPEPTLDDAAISPDAAENASLQEAEAEAARVEAEAQAAVSEPLGSAPEALGATNSESAAAKPAESSWLNSGGDTDSWDDAFDSIEGPEAAAPTAEATVPAAPLVPPGQPELPQEVESPLPEQGDSAELPEATHEPATSNQIPPAAAQPPTPSQPWGSAPLAAAAPYGPPQTNLENNPPAAFPQQSENPPGNFGPSSPQGPGESFGSANNQRKSNAKLWIFVSGAVVALALIALLIWLLMGLLKSNDPAANGGSAASSTSDSATPQSSGADGSVIQSNVNPTNWKVGDCVKGYADINTPADIVSCDTGHSGQLIGTFSYGSGESFPGEDALRKKGDDYCAGIELTASASNYDIRQQFGYPTESTWNKGDRRIDCIAYTKGGEIIKENLIK